jgi:hypothetical protein
MTVWVNALMVMVVGQKPTNRKTNMKKLLSVLAVLSLITSIAAFGADEKKKYTEGSCCAKADKKGEKCKHPCCVEAEAKGEACKKCNK